MFCVNVAFILLLQNFIALCFEPSTNRATKINLNSVTNDEEPRNFENKFKQPSELVSFSSANPTQKNDLLFHRRSNILNDLNSKPPTIKTGSDNKMTASFAGNADVDKKTQSLVVTEKDFGDLNDSFASQFVEALMLTTQRNFEVSYNNSKSANFVSNYTRQVKSDEVNIHDDAPVGQSSQIDKIKKSSSDDTLTAMFKNLMNGIGSYVKNEDTERGKRHKNISAEAGKLFQKNSDVTFAALLSDAANFLKSFIERFIDSNMPNFDDYGSPPEKVKILHRTIEGPNSFYDADRKTVLKDYCNDELIGEGYRDKICRINSGRGDPGVDFLDEQSTPSNIDETSDNPSIKQTFKHISHNVKSREDATFENLSTESLCAAKCREEELWVSQLIDQRLCVLMDQMKSLLNCDNRSCKMINRLVTRKSSKRERTSKHLCRSTGASTTSNKKPYDKSLCGFELHSSTQCSPLKGLSDQAKKSAWNTFDQNNLLASTIQPSINVYSIINRQKEKDAPLDKIECNCLELSSFESTKASINPSFEGESNEFYSERPSEKEDDYIVEEVQTSRPVQSKKFHGIPIVAITEVSRNFYVPIQHAFPSKVNSSKSQNKKPGHIIEPQEFNSTDLESLFLKLKRKSLKDEEETIAEEPNLNEKIGKLASPGNALGKKYLKSRANHRRRKSQIQDPKLSENPIVHKKQQETKKLIEHGVHEKFPYFDKRA